MRGLTEEATYELIQTQDVEFLDPAWSQISDEAKEFVLACLQKDTSKRLSAKELLVNDWLNQSASRQQAASYVHANKKRYFYKLKKVLHLS